MSLDAFGGRLRAVEAACQRWLVGHSIALLRISVGAVFFGFGVLKFFPGVSPAQDLVEATAGVLTFGRVPGDVALVAVAGLECVIGLCLISGRGMRGAVCLLGVQLLGILSPLILLAGRMFAGPHGAPTLEGQYVLKDVVIVGAALVLAATLDGARLTDEPPDQNPIPDPTPGTVTPTGIGSPAAGIGSQRSSGERRTAPERTRR